jgi:hypothetical protein
MNVCCDLIRGQLTGPFDWEQRLTVLVIISTSWRKKSLNEVPLETNHGNYSPHITSWSPQGMRVLRQCKVPRAEVMFVTVQSEKIRPSKKELNKPWKCPMFAVRLWITPSPYRWPIGSLPSTCILCTPGIVLRTFTPRRDQFVICGQ